ncbi:MAG TPA: PEP-CTERM sorting domain-containing protein [Chthoniobacterales bacterium]|nr:PEP-CTERM sorting domain-containing protein [Chthoniobacterales bacterium]
MEFQELSARDIQKNHGLGVRKSHFNQDCRESLLKAVLPILAIGLLGGFVCEQANARPIVGSIDFGGVVTYDTTSLATAARVNIWNSSFVLQDSLDFSSIAPGTNVTMAAPWIFNPSTDTPSLWVVGGFTFELTSSIVVRRDSQFLNITGTGTISSLNASATGLDPTPGVWTFSSSNSNGSNNATFGFQATTDPVPEASTMTLLAIGGFGFAALRFFRRTSRIKMMKDTEDFYCRIRPFGAQ